ncbi:MAG: hypothetical protein ABIF10_05975 [Candidatus Woesearchaeota archaeon]
MDDLIIDFSSKKTISSIEMLNASMKQLNCENISTAGWLNAKLISCQSRLLMKLILSFQSKQQICTTLPTIRKPSPALR